MPPLDAQIKSNRRRSRWLFLLFFIVYAFLGLAVSLRFGSGALVGFGVAAVVIVVFTLTMGDDMAVAMAHAKKIESRDQNPRVWDAVEVMAIAAGQPMPRVYVSPDPAPNAFAAGNDPEQAIVCVNQGLLDLLDKAELEGVVAHEMAHVKNYDVKLMTYAAVLAGGIALLAEWLSYTLFWGGGRDRDSQTAAIGAIVTLLAVILAPLAALLIQMSISRRREFLADASAAELTKYPQGLASALRKLGASEIPAETGSSATAHLCIVAPLGARGKASSLFSTHPPVEDRIARLDELAAGQLHNSSPAVA